MLVLNHKLSQFLLLIKLLFYFHLILLPYPLLDPLLVLQNFHQCFILRLCFPLARDFLPKLSYSLQQLQQSPLSLLWLLPFIQKYLQSNLSKVSLLCCTKLFQFRWQVSKSCESKYFPLDLYLLQQLSEFSCKAVILVRKCHLLPQLVTNYLHFMLRISVDYNYRDLRLAVLDWLHE